MILLNFLLSYENLLSFVKLMNVNEGDVKGLGRKDTTISLQSMSSKANDFFFSMLGTICS